jgi:hypothetical protein
MGGRVNVVGEDARAIGRERLGLKRASAGSYIIEVSRADADDPTPVNGRLKISLLGQERTLPFDLTGPRVTVGRAVVKRQSRLVPR